MCFSILGTYHPVPNLTIQNLWFRFELGVLNRFMMCKGNVAYRVWLQNHRITTSVGIEVNVGYSGRGQTLWCHLWLGNKFIKLIFFDSSARLVHFDELYDSTAGPRNCVTWRHARICRNQQGRCIMTEHFSYSQHVFSVSCPSCHVGGKTGCRQRDRPTLGVVQISTMHETHIDLDNISDLLFVIFCNTDQY